MALFGGDVPNLQGKVAIVTGGARGIGRGYSQGLAAAGAAVLIADLLESEGRETAKAIEADGGRAIFMTVDATDVDATESMAAAAAAELGGVDILVNNAAMFANLPPTPLREMAIERWMKTINVNVNGVYLCTRAVIPHMQARGGGAIVNQASIAAFGLTGGPMTDYATSKTAVVGFTKSAAKELGQFGIRVNAIAPGGTVTEAAATFVGGDLSAVEERAGMGSVLGKAMHPDDLVGPMLFLVSDSSGFMTGQTLVVDGGRYFLG
jgi:NAD(P)-dependent dehydrogenase (short-subunit alcohol dehydrogenase family)